MKDVDAYPEVFEPRRRIKRIVRSTPHRISVFPGAPPSAPKKELTFAVSKVRVIEGYVTLPQLAHERGIQAQLARLWLKSAGIKKPGERWIWKADSKALKNVRKALGLKT